MIGLLILCFQQQAFAFDSTQIQMPKINPQQLQPKTTDTDSTGHLTTVARSGSPALKCPAGYAVTAAHVGMSYYWNPYANEHVTWYCDNSCNSGFLGCGCGKTHCPSGCFAGCPSSCNYSKTSYDGGWEVSRNFIKNPVAIDYQTIGYTCSKIENKWGTPTA